jgi:hypothetical protein
MPTYRVGGVGNMDEEWSEWRHFPDPRSKGVLVAPFGPGCYQVRHISNRQKVLFGASGHVAARLSSLLPEPMGTSSRNNDDKGRHCVKYLQDLEYRTLACRSKQEAMKEEWGLMAEAREYLFAG